MHSRSRGVRWFTTWPMLAALATSSSLVPRPAPACATEVSWPGLSISGGRLYVDDALVLGSFSIFKTRASFLFFYIPDDGLWIVAPHDFSGAVECGTFDKDELSVDLDGRTLRIESAKPILGEEPAGAWVRHDPSFSLDRDVPMFGYGDSETDAYAWQNPLEAN